MSNQEPILKQLALGGFQSGQVLAESLNISRASVWNAVQKLTQSGIEIYSVRGKGYRLAKPLEMLDREKILDEVRANSDQPPPRLDVYWQIPSTNAQLMHNTVESGHVCMAEKQTAGRGRRGRTWVSPPGGNLYYSQVWQFNVGPETLSGLSLAAAVAVVKTLNTQSLNNLTLKWPNDVLYQNKKLAGILLEMSGESSGTCKVVVGVGINVRIGEEVAKDIDQKWIDIESIRQTQTKRNALAARLIIEMTRMFTLYVQKGVAPFISEWQQYDAFLNENIEVTMGDKRFQGESRGIDGQGNLLMEVDGQIQRFASGEVSLRLCDSTLAEA